MTNPENPSNTPGLQPNRDTARSIGAIGITFSDCPPAPAQNSGERRGTTDAIFIDSGIVPVGEENAGYNVDEADKIDPSDQEDDTTLKASKKRGNSKANSAKRKRIREEYFREPGFNPLLDVLD